MVTTSVHQPPLRLTRRGRAVVLLFFLLTASLASAVLFATASRANDPATAPAPTIVVQPHDTLWSIATRTSPRRDPYAAVAEIQRLNNLTDVFISPGDTLTLPRNH